MTVFNIGDRVAWPVRDGWRFGEVLRQRRCVIEEGTDRGAETLALTLFDEETGRITERSIRSCCALIAGQHVQRIVS